MPPEIREHVLASTRDHIVAAAHTGAAAIDTPISPQGRKEFAIYYRLLPWDHGAPALVLRESGGCVEHLDGRPYSVRSAHQITLVGRDKRGRAPPAGWLGQ